MEHIYRNARKKGRERKEREEKLPPKQELFCELYVKSFNATMSYVEAFDCKDKNRAAVEGCKLLKNSKVNNRVKYLKELKRQSIMLTKDDVVERRMKIAFSDMTDFVEWGQEEINVIGRFGPIEIKNPITGEKEILKEKTNVVRFKDSNLVDGGLISEIKTGKDTSIKLEDRQKALDWLAKYFLMNPLDKHKIDFDNKKFEQDKQEHADKMAMEKEKTSNDTGLPPVVFIENSDKYLEWKKRRDLENGLPET